jgi:hypothetical protein
MKREVCHVSISCIPQAAAMQTKTVRLEVATGPSNVELDWRSQRDEASEGQGGLMSAEKLAPILLSG